MFTCIIARIVAGSFIVFCVLMLSQRLKNAMYALLIGSAIFGLPALLSIYGLDNAKWFSLYPLFHFGAMMQKTSTAIYAWLSLLIILAIGLEILYTIFNKWCE